DLCADLAGRRRADGGQSTARHPAPDAGPKQAVKRLHEPALWSAASSAAFPFCGAGGRRAPRKNGRAAMLAALQKETGHSSNFFAFLASSATTASSTRSPSRPTT